jgi:hypothetical protein
VDTRTLFKLHFFDALNKGIERFYRDVDIPVVVFRGFVVHALAYFEADYAFAVVEAQRRRVLIPSRYNGVRDA